MFPSLLFFWDTHLIDFGVTADCCPTLIHLHSCLL